MTRLLLAAALLLCASVASAQTTGTPTEADLARLPMAISVWFPMPAEWTGYPEFWAYSLWSRDVTGSGRGNWYRAVPEQPVISIYRENVFPRPYTCRYVRHWVFACTDVFGAVRYVECPAELAASPEPREWTSERGRWLWDWDGGADQKWKAFSERIVLPITSGSPSEDGKRVACHYAVTKATGAAYDRSDTWVQWR